MLSSTTTRAVLVLGVLVSAIALAACGSSGSGASTPSAVASQAAPSAAAPSGSASAGASTEAGGANAVTIQNFAFGPATVSVPVGTTVTWTNADSATHTVTADDGSFDSSSLASGATFSQTFATAGTFAYHCKIHPNMKATVEVK